MAMVAISPIAAFRMGRNLTQAALGQMLGVSRETIARWETGARRIDPELVPLVSKRTGIPKGVLRPDLAELFGR
jgi:transcriptional regulator with XRE-family HTH domain